MVFLSQTSTELSLPVMSCFSCVVRGIEIELGTNTAVKEAVNCVSS